MFRETYWLEISRDVPVPSLGQIAVTLFVDDEEQRHLPASGPQGGALGERALFGRLPVRAAEPSQYSIQTAVQYSLEEPGGGRIALVGYGGGALEGPLGRSLPLTLFWQGEDPIDNDYTVFVQLWDSRGKFAYGQDSPPVQGRYPTGLWARGEMVRDERWLSLPLGLSPGTYEVRVGLYRLDSGARLAAFDDAGRRVRDDAILLLRLEVATEVYQGFLPYLLR